MVWKYVKQDRKAEDHNRKSKKGKVEENCVEINKDEDLKIWLPKTSEDFFDQRPLLNTGRIQLARNHF